MVKPRYDTVYFLNHIII
ncbi:MAG TPA: hypothetical protein LFV92_07495 [Rickettsia endosymbiont of Ceroptres masudai]|nr:hypothetical protein [Rickettsia endosymbiont of Ceroptres masudai]